MAESIHLTGTEDVLRASHNIQSGAVDFQRAANQIDNSLYIFLDRFEGLIQRMEELSG